MTTGRPSPRPPPLDPSTPRARFKNKNSRPRPSPATPRTSANQSAKTAAAVSTAAAAAAAAAAATPGIPSAHHHHQVQMALQRQNQADHAINKHRVAGLKDDMEIRRMKQISGAAAAAAKAAAAAATAKVVPSSPTTSSRSRGGRRPRRGATDGESSATEGRIRVTKKSSSISSGCFSVEGVNLTAGPKMSAFYKRLFGHEIQCLMHAFGEVRYGARHVLELVEDEVRESVLRVVLRAHEYAVEEARLKGETTDRVSLNSKHVARCLFRDHRAVMRFNQSMKHSAELHPNLLPSDKASLSSVTPMRAWQVVAEMGDLNVVNPGLELTHEKPTNDIQALCGWRSVHAFRSAMGSQQFRDFIKCRGVSLVRQESLSRAPLIRSQPRIVLFREWLNVSRNFNFPIPDETLFALGHIAWELIGLITQTALVQRHFSDINNGKGDPRSEGWSFSRHLISALNHGLATAILVPITDIQGNTLFQEIEVYKTVVQMTHYRNRPHKFSSSSCLLPQHIQAAIEKIGSSRHAALSFAVSSAQTP